MPETREQRRLAGLIQDEGTAWDIGWAAVYLASDESRWVTGQVIELHLTGRIRILAAGSPGRHPALPDIPTAIESGVAAMIVQNFFGIFGPARLPKTVVDRLNEATQAALADRNFGDTLSAAGFEPLPGLGPEKAKTFLKDEYARWQTVVKAAGIKD